MTNEIKKEAQHTPVPSVPTPSYQRTTVHITFAVIFAAVTFFSGLHIGSGLTGNLSVNSFFPGHKTEASESVRDLQIFWEVWELLNTKFVNSTTTDDVSDEDLIHGAIAGMVRAYGDPYTVYLPPEEASMFEDDISGNFSGVGMEVGMRDSLLTIIAPLPDSPAFRAGLRAGDSIIRIDDVSTESMSVDEAVKRIRGEAGTTVTFSIFREGDSEFRTVEVVRDTITIPITKIEEYGDVFVLKLYSFNALSEVETQKALRQFVKSKKSKLVLDLRGNPGGYLQSAVAIGSFFLPIGKTVVRENFGDNENETVYRSSGKTFRTFTPENFVVLVDGGSASASEILAGALKEHGVATIIGSQTFGKGSVQELIRLDNNASLKVTIARWLTPLGLSISENGLTPDIVVDITEDDRANERDPQLDRAREFLES